MANFENATLFIVTDGGSLGEWYFLFRRLDFRTGTSFGLTSYFVRRIDTFCLSLAP